VIGDEGLSCARRRTDYRERENVLNKHRDALELAASAKHQRGQHDESGTVIVDAGDLKTSSP
jgi:hypothetical protein